MLKGKTVVLGVTGSIAAYKIANLTSMLTKLHCDVHVIMTKNATNIINPITFETLTAHKCLVDTFDRNFNYNLKKLKEFGMEVIEPASGMLACRVEGKGKLPSEEVLLEYILREIQFEKDMTGKKVLVTAGATQEAIDPVRYITNHSTGKMGYALAKIAMRRGADVTLITAPTNLPAPLFADVVPVVSAQEMFDAVKERAPKMDIIIKAAAVADYTPVSVSDEKIKKKDGDLSLPMRRTTDILAYLGEHRKPGQFICGFSMETENLVENSKKKLQKKNADLIVANNLRDEGAGFGTDTNVVTLVMEEGIVELPCMSKEEVAEAVLDAIQNA